MIKSSFIRRLFYNWHIKLISLALAFILWKYVDSLNEKERYLNVRLNVKNIPQGYVIVNEIPKYVRIVVKGKDEYLSVIDSSNFNAFIDLKNFPGVASEVPVKIEKANVPRNILIKDVNPSSVAVKIEQLEEKVVTVEPVVVGKPKKGYLVEDILINPSTAKIKGPSSEIKSIGKIYTKEIDINNIGLNASFNVPLIINQYPNVKIVGNNYVNVIIKIVEKYNLLEINDIQLKFLNLKKNFVLVPKNVYVDVKVRIPVRLSNVVSKNDILAYVDCTDLERAGKFILPIQIKTLRKDMQVIGYAPEDVEFEIKRVYK